MKRRAVVVAAACSIAFGASGVIAQERQIGLTFGASLASVERESGPAGQDPYDGRTGITGGAFIHLPVRGRIHLQVETLFTEKGGSVPLRDPSIISGSVTIRYKFHYMDVPVLARVRGPRLGSAHLHGFAGPTFSVRLAGEQQTVFAGEGAFGFERELGDEMDRFDAGMTAGAGVEIGRALFEVRYTHGLKAVMTDLDGARLSNRGFLVTAGVRIF
jgi:hypothetical protein